MRIVNLPERKRLPHDVPLFVDLRREIYFITIGCAERNRNELAVPKVAAALYHSIVYQNQRRVWFAHLFMLMPDHVHALLSFPPEGKPIKEVIRLWKHWTAVKIGIHWQRDFFEHRLRHDESRREKADYILNNPVRAGLVGSASDWPYVWWADGNGGLCGWAEQSISTDGDGAPSLP
jgi:putative transposase